MRVYTKRATPVKDRIQSKFSEILAFVQTGQSIQNACRAVDETSSNLYKNITPDQQRLLDEARAANNGCIGSIKTPAVSRGKGRQSRAVTNFFGEEEDEDDF